MPKNSFDEPLIDKEEDEPIQLQPRPTSKLVKNLFIVQLITLCLLPVLYRLGYNRGSQIFPKLPTHCTNLAFVFDDG